MMIELQGVNGGLLELMFQTAAVGIMMFILFQA